MHKKSPTSLLVTSELRRAKVEPEGIEPSSKQSTPWLSTCLFCDWFSSKSWTQTPEFLA